MSPEAALPVIPLVILAQNAGEDLKRDAGLRGEQFSNAVWGLSIVFLLGLIVLGFVVFKGRRKRS